MYPEYLASEKPWSPPGVGVDVAAVDILRLLDANLNRAAEGLRTLEDVCRLVYENAGCVALAKGLRHRLAELAQRVPRIERLAARNTRDDAGTSTTTQAEQSRESWGAIVAAACERTQQAMRCLEEFGKLWDAPLAMEFKQLRYLAYDVLAEIEVRLCSPAPAAASLRCQRLAAAKLYLLVDCDLALEEFTEQLRELAAAGVDAFQLRDKQRDGQTLMRYARAAVACLAPSNALFIVNDRLDVALASGAAGVHLGQEDLGLLDARKIARGELLIGISTHDLQQAREAEQGGADYIGCGPTFPSQTKQFAAFAGTAFLAEVAQHISIPAFAIGGIDAQNVDRVREAGVSRIAVSQAILASQTPTLAARELAERLDPGGQPLHVSGG